MMEEKIQSAGRKHPAHQPVFERTNRSPIVFVTVCSKDRKPIFANSAAHDVVVRAWKMADQWAVGSYVLMPDHIHFFCLPVGCEYPPLKKWISFWKTMVWREWTEPAEQPIWQSDFWDTQLRAGDSYGEKWHYVRINPVRAGLVDQSDDWPYQETIETLFWHD
jgi:REP element-mobilizing transposase RayT